ncbi:hypothetical protein DPMN_055653 [Dreissena polymorpha]|uniref:Uncharacterized protein n=1 Tax=Dreissena polymorpha TaxID=45954 RepID=A0A9D4CQC2_DREPO|nr:hypothetical protein DPMN_055653 [Dreissena polymorpha]
MQKQVNDVMENKVFKTLDNISNFYLFDQELAFSRSWEMLRTAGDRSAMLQEYVEVVMEGLQTVANILAVKKLRDRAWAHDSFMSLSYASFYGGVKPLPSKNLSVLPQPDPHGKGKRVSVIVDPEEVEREKQKVQQEEQLVLDLTDET